MYLLYRVLLQYSSPLLHYLWQVMLKSGSHLPFKNDKKYFFYLMVKAVFFLEIFTFLL